MCGGQRQRPRPMPALRGSELPVKEELMKLTAAWHRNKATRNARRKRQAPKIHWQRLGFTTPARESTAVSMDEIRRQVVALASLGFGAETRARSTSGGRQGPARTEHPELKRKPRRGATT